MKLTGSNWQELEGIFKRIDWGENGWRTLLDNVASAVDKTAADNPFAEIVGVRGTENRYSRLKTCVETISDESMTIAFVSRLRNLACNSKDQLILNELLAGSHGSMDSTPTAPSAIVQMTGDDTALQQELQAYAISRDWTRMLRRLDEEISHLGLSVRSRELENIVDLMRFEMQELRRFKARNGIIREEEQARISSLWEKCSPLIGKIG